MPSSKNEKDEKITQDNNNIDNAVDINQTPGNSQNKSLLDVETTKDGDIDIKNVLELDENDTYNIRNKENEHGKINFAQKEEQPETDDLLSDLNTVENENSIAKQSPYRKLDDLNNVDDLKRVKSSHIPYKTLQIPLKKVKNILLQNMTNKNHIASSVEGIREGVSLLMEVFIEKCIDKMKLSNRKTLLISDLKYVANNDEEFLFLKDLFED